MCYQIQVFVFHTWPRMSLLCQGPWSGLLLGGGCRRPAELPGVHLQRQDTEAGVHVSRTCREHSDSFRGYKRSQKRCVHLLRQYVLAATKQARYSLDFAYPSHTLPRALWPSCVSFATSNGFKSKNTRQLPSTDQQTCGSHPKATEHTPCRILSTTLGLKRPPTCAQGGPPGLTEWGT